MFQLGLFDHQGLIRKSLLYKASNPRKKNGIKEDIVCSTKFWSLCLNPLLVNEIGVTMKIIGLLFDFFIICLQNIKPSTGNHRTRGDAHVAVAKMFEKLDAPTMTEHSKKIRNY